MIGSKAGEQEVGRIDGHERIRPTHDQLSLCGDENSENDNMIMPFNKRPIPIIRPYGTFL